MSRIAISCDSTCSINRDDAQKEGIYILPLNVIVDNVEYHDGIDINQKKLATMMKGGSIIKTSTPTFGELEQHFDHIFEQRYDHIIHICISSKLTSIYNMTTKFCQEKYGDKVTVIDSLNVCSFMGNLVRYANELVKKEFTVEQVVQEVNERIGSEEIYFFPETLTYLKRGGRISPAIALLGNLIGIKPVLKFIDGAIEKEGTTHVVKKECEKLLRNFAEKNYDPNLFEIHLIEFDSPNLEEYVFQKILEILPCFEIKRSPISINVCAHAGPGTIGIGMCRKI